MSRTQKGTKGIGAEYWSKRPGSNKCGSTPGKASKRLTHRAERREAKKMFETDDFEISANTLNMMDESMKNLNKQTKDLFWFSTAVPTPTTMVQPVKKKVVKLSERPFKTRSIRRQMV